MNRSRRIAANVIASFLLNVVHFIFPFIIRTLVVYRLGDQYTGIGGLFSSILTVLNVAELGFSNAVVYFMYKPMAEKDNDQLCKLLNYMRMVFLIVGCVVSAFGLALCPFIDRFIKGTLPEDLNVYILYLLYLLNTVAGYFFGGYKRTILLAGQRNDVEANINSVVYAVSSILQIVVLLLFPNYYLYIIILPMESIAANLIIARRSSALFPNVKPVGKIDASERKSIVDKVKALFLYKIGTIVLTSSDNIIISMFLGLSIITYYGNYYQIINSFYVLTYVAFAAATSTIANKMAESGIKEIKQLFGTIQFWVCTISGIVVVGYILLIQDLMQLWMGQERMLGFETVVLLAILFYLLQLRRTAIIIYDVQGLWDKSPLAPLISGVLNLCSNVILVQIIGIDGIVLSTIMGYALVSIPWEFHIIFKNCYKEGKRGFLRDNLEYVIIIIVNLFVSGFVCRFITQTGALGIFIKGLIILIISLCLNYVIWHKTEYYKCGLEFAGKAIKR